MGSTDNKLLPGIPQEGNAKEMWGINLGKAPWEKRDVWHRELGCGTVWKAGGGKFSFLSYKTGGIFIEFLKICSPYGCKYDIVTAFCKNARQLSLREPGGEKLWHGGEGRDCNPSLVSFLPVWEQANVLIPGLLTVLEPPLSCRTNGRSK